MSKNYERPGFTAPQGFVNSKITRTETRWTPHAVHYDLSQMPAIAPKDLTAESTIAEASICYIQNCEKVTEALKAGKNQAAHPHIRTARSEHGHLKLKTITKRWAKLYQMELFQSGRTGGTVNNVISVYKRLFTWLEELELVPTNPFSNITRMPMTKKKREVRALNDEDKKEMLDYLKNIKSYLGRPQGIFSDMAELGFESAMRYNEIYSLEWENVDLSGAIPKAYITERIAKTRTRRTVILSPRAVEIIEAQGTSSGFVFCQVGYASVQRHLQKLTKKSGKNYFFYLTRHTSITIFAADASSLSEIQAYSGHATKKSVEAYANHDLAYLQEKVYKRLSENHQKSV